MSWIAWSVHWVATGMIYGAVLLAGGLSQPPVMPDHKLMTDHPTPKASLLSQLYFRVRGTRWRSWLRHYATNRNVAGSIPDGVTGIFHWHNRSGRTMAMGSTQPPTEMSTRNLSWGGKGGRCVGLTTLPPSCADCLKNQGASTSWIPRGLPRPVMGLLYVLLLRSLYTFMI
jgi:hypothetical protein